MYNLKQTDISIFRKFLKERLPSFMIPHYIEKLEKIEITHNQKIDYKKLQQIALQKHSKLQKADKKDIYQDTVSKVKSIWIKHLGNTQHIGLDDSFFDMGGDSVMAVDLYHDICHEFNIKKLDPYVFYTSPTIKKLSLEINKAQKTDILSSIFLKNTSSNTTIKEKFSPTFMVFKILKKINQIRSLFHWKKGVKKGPISPQQRSFITLKQLLGVNCNGYFSIPIKGKC